MNPLPFIILSYAIGIAVPAALALAAALRMWAAERRWRAVDAGVRRR